MTEIMPVPTSLDITVLPAGGFGYLFYLANPVSLERQGRGLLILAKKKSLERDMRPDSVWWRRRWDSNPRAYL